jgi:hypothetical protein
MPALTFSVILLSALIETLVAPTLVTTPAQRRRDERLDQCRQEDYRERQGGHGSRSRGEWGHDGEEATMMGRLIRWPNRLKLQRRD